jgi:hypothetical protein
MARPAVWRYHGGGSSVASNPFVVAAREGETMAMIRYEPASRKNVDR